MILLSPFPKYRQAVTVHFKPVAVFRLDMYTAATTLARMVATAAGGLIFRIYCGKVFDVSRYPRRNSMVMVPPRTAIARNQNGGGWREAGGGGTEQSGISSDATCGSWGTD